MLRELLGNLISGWAMILARSGVALVLVPFLLTHLGKEGYGLIGLLAVIISCADVADLGLRSALGRELSEKIAKDDIDGFRKLSSTALALYLAMALILSALGWVLAPWLLDVFKVGEGLRVQGVWLIRIFGSLSVIMSFLVPVFTAGLTSFMRFGAVNAVQAGRALLSGIILFVAIPLLRASPFVVWACVMLGVTFLSILLMYVLYRRWCFSGKLSLKYFDIRQLKSLFQLGGYMYALQMTNTLAERANPLVVSAFMGPAGVALYQSGTKLSAMLRPIVMTFVNQIYPITTRFHVKAQQDKQQMLFLLGSKYTMLLGVLAGVGIFVFAEPFCRLWLYGSLGADYSTVVLVVQLSAIIDLTAFARGTQWPVLLGMKRLKFLVWAQLPAAVLNVLISIYLVGLAGFGISGVLYATIIINVVRLPILTWYTAKLVGVSLWDCFVKSYFSPLTCLIITYVCAKTILHFLICDSWTTLVLGVFLISSCWLVIVGVVGMSVEERRLFIRQVVKRAVN